MATSLGLGFSLSLSSKTLSPHSSEKLSTSHRTPSSVILSKGRPLLESGRISPFSVFSQTEKSKKSFVCSAVLDDVVGNTMDGNVTEIFSKEDFEKCIKEAGDKLVVLDIATRTCGPCKLIYPKVVKLSLDYPDVVFLKIMGDYDSSTKALMREWGVRAVPNFRFFKNGDLIHKHNGAKEEELLQNFQKFYSQVVA